jgi:photosystem II stability/assembly factor-like uncharacterized protein
LNSVYFTDTNHGWIAAAKGKVLRTEDWGSTWNVSLTATLDFSSVFFVSEQKGWVFCWGGLYKTANGGLKWDKVSSYSTDFTGAIYFLNEMTG